MDDETKSFMSNDELQAYYDKQVQKYISMIEREFSSTSYFSPTKEEQKRIAAWFKEQDTKVVQMQQQSGRYKDNPWVQALHQHGRGYYGASGGALTYNFTPTGMGTVFTVSHALTEETLDLSDYDNW